MTVAQTSVAAFKSLKDLGDKQRSVYETLGNLGVASNQEVADALDWTINRVTGRMKELRDFGFVEVHGTKRNSFGNTVKTWRTANPMVVREVERAAPRYQAMSWLKDAEECAV